MGARNRSKVGTFGQFWALTAPFFAYSIFKEPAHLPPRRNWIAAVPRIAVVPEYQMAIASPTTLVIPATRGVPATFVDGRFETFPLREEQESIAAVPRTAGLPSFGWAALAATNKELGGAVSSKSKEIGPALPLARESYPWARALDRAIGR